MSDILIVIGGSAIRSFNALVHHAAAGHGRKHLYYQVIDSDINGISLSRLRESLGSYQSVRDSIGIDPARDYPMFKTIFEPLILNGGVKTWPEAQGIDTLETMINLQVLNPKDNLERDLIEYCNIHLTREQLQLKLYKGFAGQKSLGSLLMALKFLQSDLWRNIVSSIRAKLEGVTGNRGLRVFIMASSFGAMGAAGFPTISRLLMNEFDQEIQNKRVVFGGGLILPYFRFDDKEGMQDIDKSPYAKSKFFMADTELTLDYFRRIYKMKTTDRLSSEELRKQVPFQTLYCVGSPSYKTYKFGKGGTSQDNPAHYVESFTALAAVDFFERDIDDFHSFHCRYAKCNEKDGISLQWDDIPVETDPGDINKQTKTHNHFRKKMITFTQIVFAMESFLIPLINMNQFPDETARINGDRFKWWKRMFTAEVDVQNILSRDIRDNLHRYWSGYYLTWLVQLLNSEDNTYLMNKISVLKSDLWDEKSGKLDMTGVNYRHIPMIPFDEHPKRECPASLDPILRNNQIIDSISTSAIGHFGYAKLLYFLYESLLSLAPGAFEKANAKIESSESNEEGE